MQIGKNKSESKQKQTNSLAKMMARREKEKLQGQSRQAYIGLLEEPRSEKYKSLLFRMTEIGEQLEEIEEQIKGLEQEAKMLPVSDVLEEAEESKVLENVSKEEENKVKSLENIVQEPDRPKWWEAGTTETVQEEKKTWWGSTVSSENNAPSVEEIIQKRKEIEKKSLELKQKREDMVKELKETHQKFLQELPAPKRTLGVIYSDEKAGILLKYGVIACPGNKFSSQEELIRQVKPRTQKEEEQWRKGDDAYRDYYCSTLLVVEIYIDAICVVYDDGKSIVVA